MWGRTKRDNEGVDTAGDLGGVAQSDIEEALRAACELMSGLQDAEQRVLEQRAAAERLLAEAAAAQEQLARQRAEAERRLAILQAEKERLRIAQREAQIERAAAELRDREENAAQQREALNKTSRERSEVERQIEELRLAEESAAQAAAACEARINEIRAEEQRLADERAALTDRAAEHVEVMRNASRKPAHTSSVYAAVSKRRSSSRSGRAATTDAPKRPGAPRSAGQPTQSARPRHNVSHRDDDRERDVHELRRVQHRKFGETRRALSRSGRVLPRVRREARPTARAGGAGDDRGTAARSSPTTSRRGQAETQARIRPPSLHRRGSGIRRARRGSSRLSSLLYRRTVGEFDRMRLRDEHVGTSAEAHPGVPPQRGRRERERRRAGRNADDSFGCDPPSGRDARRRGDARRREYLARPERRRVPHSDRPGRKLEESRRACRPPAERCASHRDRT